MGGLHNSIKILFSLFDLDPVLVQSDLSLSRYILTWKIPTQKSLKPSSSKILWTFVGLVLKSARPWSSGEHLYRFCQKSENYISLWLLQSQWHSEETYIGVSPYRLPTGSIVLLNILQLLFAPLQYSKMTLNLLNQAKICQNPTKSLEKMPKHVSKCLQMSQIYPNVSS